VRRAAPTTPARSRVNRPQTTGRSGSFHCAVWFFPKTSVSPWTRDYRCYPLPLSAVTTSDPGTGGLSRWGYTVCYGRERSSAGRMVTFIIALLYIVTSSMRLAHYFICGSLHYNRAIGRRRLTPNRKSSEGPNSDDNSPPLVSYSQSKPLTTFRFRRLDPETKMPSSLSVMQQPATNRRCSSRLLWFASVTFCTDFHPTPHHPCYL